MMDYPSPPSVTRSPAPPSAMAEGHLASISDESLAALTGKRPFFSRFPRLLGAVDKVRRRARRLAGRPDNTPWVMRGTLRPTSNEVVDFLFALDYASPNSTLCRMFREAFGALGMSVLLVNKQNIERVIEQVRHGWIRPTGILDLASSSDRRIDTLCRIAERLGIYAAGMPSIVDAWAMKAPSQAKLEAGGVPVPPTVIFWQGEPDRDLTAEERAKVGDRVVIKPSHGVASLGCVVGVEPTRDVIAKARNYTRQDHWLVQKMISWPRLDNGRQAYIRSYNIFGHRSLLWWCKENGMDCYDPMTWDDVHRYDLLPAIKITDRIAELSGLDYFSSEIAITKLQGPDRFMLIDYINDQCDLDPDTSPGRRMVPEAWSRWVCEKTAEFMYRKKHGLPEPAEKTLFQF